MHCLNRFFTDIILNSMPDSLRFIYTGMIRIAHDIKLFAISSSMPDPGPHLLHLQVNDDTEADLYPKLQTACTFIGRYIMYNKFYMFQYTRVNNVK